MKKSLVNKLIVPVVVAGLALGCTTFGKLHCVLPTQNGVNIQTYDSSSDTGMNGFINASANPENACYGPEQNRVVINDAAPDTTSPIVKEFLSSPVQCLTPGINVNGDNYLCCRLY